MKKCIRIGCGREIQDDALFCPYCGKRQESAPAPQRKKHRRPNGSGSVAKVSGNRAKPWRATMAKKLIGYYATSSEAVFALEKYAAETEHCPRHDMTFEQLYNDWKAVHFEGVSDKAISGYERSFERAEALHGMKMRDIKTDDYQRIINGMAGMSRSTQEKQRQLFSQLCKYAIPMDIIDKNYASFVQINAQYTPRNRVFTDTEIAQISLMCNDDRLGDTARIAMFMIRTGMRIGEVFTLKVENINLAERYMVGGEKTEAGRDRTVPIPTDIEPFILEWMGDRESGLLLQTKRGKHRSTSNYEKSFASLMDKLGIRGATPHTCRHTAATRMVGANLRLDSVKQILGHKDVTTTLNYYTHPDAQSLVEEMDKLSG